MNDGATRSLEARLRAEEPGAFEDLVRTYGGRMRATARSMLASQADADDAVQDAFLAAFRSLDRFEGRSQLGTWLHRIVVNAALMKMRARSARPEQELNELLPEFNSAGVFSDRQEGWGEWTEGAVARGEVRARVRECIAELPEKFRTPLLVRDIEGLSTQELAARLGTSTNTAKVRLHRARQALRTLVEQRLGKSST